MIIDYSQNFRIGVASKVSGIDNLIFCEVEALTKAYSKKGITVKCKPVVTAHNKMFMGAFVDAAVSKYSSWDEKAMTEALDKDYKALNALCKFKKGDKNSVEIST